MRVVHVLFPLALALPALAQEMEIPKPAKELAKYQKLIGSWEGSGQVWMEAGGQPMPWTATSTCKEMLGGFCLQEDTEVDLGAEVPTPLQMRAIHGFDNENKKYVTYGVSNQGVGKTEQVHWIGDTLFTSSSGIDPESGLPYVDRSLVKYGVDSYDLKIDRAVGDGDFFTHVTGTFKRAKTAKAGFAREASFMQMPVTPAMSKFTKLCGKFDIAGSMIPAPGAPEMKISGTDTMTEIFGGQAIMQVTKGDPIPGMGAYESLGFMSWDPEKKCYHNFYCDNMGMIGTTEGRWDGEDKIVFTANALFQGEPQVNRVVLHIGEGGITKVTNDAITGSGEAQRNFVGTYTKSK